MHRAKFNQLFVGGGGRKDQFINEENIKAHEDRIEFQRNNLHM
jgi:hypothetical protein